MTIRTEQAEHRHLAWYNNLYLKEKKKYWSQEIGTMTVPIKRSRAKYLEKQQQWIMKPLMIKTDQTHISIYILIYSTVSNVRTNLAEYTKQNSNQLMVSIKPESISTRPSCHNWKSKQKQTQKMQKMQNLVAVFLSKEAESEEIAPKYIPTAIQSLNGRRKAILGENASVNGSDRRPSINGGLGLLHLNQILHLRHSPASVTE